MKYKNFKFSFKGFKLKLNEKELLIFDKSSENLSSI